MYPGCAATRSSHARTAGKGARSKPPSCATWVYAYSAMSLRGARRAVVDVVFDALERPTQLRQQQASLVGVAGRGVVVEAQHASFLAPRARQAQLGGIMSMRGETCWSCW